MSFFFSKPNKDDIKEFLSKNRKYIYTELKEEKKEELKTLSDLVKKENAKLIICKKKQSNILECPICFSNNINMCFVPCGHTFCSKCVKDITQCYLCNQEIFLKQKIFI